MISQNWRFSAVLDAQSQSTPGLATLWVFLRFCAKKEASRFAPTCSSKSDFKKKLCKYVVGGEMILHPNPTSMIPRSRALRHAILAKRLAMISAGVSLLVCTAGLANGEDWPKFRKGGWQFDGTLAVTVMAQRIAACDCGRRAVASRPPAIAAAMTRPDTDPAVIGVFAPVESQLNPF